MTTKKNEKDEEKAFREGMALELKDARKLVKTIFEIEHPSALAVKLMWDILSAVGEPDDEFAEDIVEARLHAMEAFETKTPAAEEVLVTFLAVFVNEEDEE